jgi:hypothetical protein
MSSGKILFAGLPTGPDVQNLIDTLGMPNEGDHIPYADVEAVLGLTRKSDPHRWASVTGAWKRRVEREANVILKAVMNRGFDALTPSGRVDHSGRTYKGGLKKIVRASNVAAGTDRTSLSPEEARTCDHIQNTGAQLKLAAATAARRLKAPIGNAKPSP